MMGHHLSTVLLLTAGFALASLFAYVMQRLKLPTILGYLLAGYIIGPYSPGFVAEPNISDQLAEIGVILMLFGVGLHFKLEDLIKVRRIAIPGAVGQTLVATLSTMFIVSQNGGTLETGLIVGLAVGVASTVVLVRLLMENHLLNTPEGHIAVGWLVVEDIFTVIILILLPTIAAFSQGEALSFLGIAQTTLLVLGKFLLLALFMFTWGYKIVSAVLTSVARLRSQELFTLSVLALVFLIATGSLLVFGTSIALGAFIAGMVIGKTSVKHQAAANALPLKDIFAIIFFISVGMLFNPMAIAQNIPLFLGILFVILIVKPLVALLITLFFNYSAKIALTVAVSLAQIGEFSFILAEEAMNLNLIPESAFDILVASALVSISLNPLLFQMLGLFEKMLHKLPFYKKSLTKGRKVASNLEKLQPQVVLIGYGPIGKKVATILRTAHLSPMIIEQNIDTVEKLEENHNIIFGDASDASILKEAQVERAGWLIITIPDTLKTLEIIRVARQKNPAIEIAARIQFISEIPLVEGLKVHYICSEEEALEKFALLIQEFLSQKL